MPVVVTGADQPLGRALALALADLGVPDVRAVVRGREAAAPLRSAGVRVSVGDMSDPLRFGAVLEGAHTVVHLDTPPLATWEWLLDAAEDTGLRRIVTVLPHGVAAPQAAAYETVLVPGDIPGPGEAADDALLAVLIEADRRR